MRLRLDEPFYAGIDKSVVGLAKSFGGQRTNDAPSWSPDGARVAFVSYQSVP